MMSRSWNAVRRRPRAPWLHAAIALLIALTAVAPGLAPTGVAQSDKDILSCRGGVDPGLWLDWETCRVYFRPGHSGGFFGIEVRTNFKGAKATFPDLLGAAGGEVTKGKRNGKSWKFSYTVPAGATDSGSKEILVEAADGSGAGEAIPIYSDGTAPEAEITAPASGAVLKEPKLDVTVEGGDLADPRMQPSGLFSVELFEVGTRNGQPYQTSLKQAGITSLPYTFVKAKVSEDATGLMVRATDNVGNTGDSPVVPICVESSGTCGGPEPTPTPPPGNVNPDEWTTAETISSLPFSQILDTDDLDSSPDDPACQFPNGDVSEYESSAWFRVNLPNDAQVHITTVGSEFDNGNPQDYDEELDTVLMIMVRNGNQWSVMQCVDDLHNPDDPSGDSDLLEAAMTIGLHGGIDYYVMAGVVRYPEEEEEVGYLLVEMDQI